MKISSTCLTNNEKIEICQNCGKSYVPKYRVLTGLNKTIKTHCDCKVLEHEKSLSEINKREKLNKYHYLFKQSRLGSRFKNSSFEKLKINFINKSIISKLRYIGNNYDKKRHDSIIVSGKPGTGKTLITSCFANILLDNLINCVFYNVPELIGDYKNTQNFKNDLNPGFFLSSLANCSVLILDDLGSEEIKTNDEIIYRLINSRYEANKFTVFTTNLTLKSLASRYGERIFSRIVDMCSREHMYSLDKEVNYRLVKFKSK